MPPDQVPDILFTILYIYIYIREGLLLETSQRLKKKLLTSGHHWTLKDNMPMPDGGEVTTASRSFLTNGKPRWSSSTAIFAIWWGETGWTTEKNMSGKFTAPRVSFCVPLLIDPENAYEISWRPTPDMEAVGKAPGTNLSGKASVSGRSESVPAQCSQCWLTRSISCRFAKSITKLPMDEWMTMTWLTIYYLAG